MRLVLTVSLASLMLVAPLSANVMPHIRRGPTAPRVAKTKHKMAGIEPERATQIQTALIKAGYLTGTPSGQWDTETQAAMEKMQAANGWQTKLVPDSRAIIKLGLGPNATGLAASSPEPAANETATPENGIASGESKF